MERKFSLKVFSVIVMLLLSTTVVGAVIQGHAQGTGGTYTQLVVRGTNNDIWYCRYNQANGVYGSWLKLPGSTALAPATAYLNDNLHVVVQGAGQSLWHGWIDSVGVFSGWNLLDGTTPSPPSLTSNGTALCLTVRGSVGDLIWYRYYIDGTWGNWRQVPNGASPDTPHVILNQNQATVPAPLDGTTVKIGYIASDSTSYSVGQPFLEQIVKPDLNAYAAKLGYNVNFDFVYKDADGQDTTHLEKVQELKAAGVDLFIGGGWSSQAQGSLSYVNTHGMLMFSSSSTSPTLAIANDNFFRMCTADSHLAPALADVMWAAGVKSVVIFQRGDSWGDGIVNLFKPLWTAKGGVLAGDTIRYAAEATEFSNYLTVADQQVATAVANYGGQTQRVGVIMLSFNEIGVILSQASSYPNIYNVHWWGSDGTALSQRAMDDAPTQAIHVGLYSLLSREEISSKYTNLAARYEALTGQQFSSYTGYMYDIAFVMARAVLEAQSTRGTDVIPLIQPICYDTYGAVGWCRLDAAGDRWAPSYDVWGFFPGDGTPCVSKIMAQYDQDTHTTVFYPAVLGYTPIGP